MRNVIREKKGPLEIKKSSLKNGDNLIVELSIDPLHFELLHLRQELYDDAIDSMRVIELNRTSLYLRACLEVN